jgi:ubiquinone/menaquinone biosynthesis C-methylase UbiE
MNELLEIEARYARRKQVDFRQLYDPLKLENLLMRQEKERVLRRHLKRWVGGRLLSDMRIAEVGCGSGVNLLHLLSLGAEPENLIANELLEDRMAQARRRLPASVTFAPGNAVELGIEPSSLDIVMQSTVFSSILDAVIRRDLARSMMDWLKPGGCVLWYDFTYDNPKNPDVTGITMTEIRRLAPPIARRLGFAASIAYPVLNVLPLLRTHLLCTLKKTA